MTDAILSQANQAAFRGDLKAQQKQAERAVTLLEQAVSTLRADDLAEPTGVRAQRMRGAVVLIQSASLELAVTCGWLECADAAEAHELTRSPADTDPGAP